MSRYRETTVSRYITKPGRVGRRLFERLSMRAWLTCLWILTLSTACGGGGDGGDDGESELAPPDPNDQTTRGRVLGFVNAIADSPTIRITYQSTNEVMAAPSGEIDLAFSEGEAFTTTVGGYEITVAYERPTGESVMLFEYVGADLIDLRQDDEVIFVLADRLEAPQAIRIENVEYLFGLPDDPESPPVVDPEIQFLHTVADEGELDFYLTQASASISHAMPVATLAFGEHTAPVGFEARDDYRLRITPQGDPSSVLYDSRSFRVPVTSRRLIAAFDYFGPGEGRLQAKMISTESLRFPNEVLPTAFRFANLVADVPSVDVYFGNTSGAPVLAEVGVGDRSGYVEIEDGSYAINVTPTGVDNEFVYQNRHALASGTASTLVIAGLASDESDGGSSKVEGSLVTDDNRPNAEIARVSVAHASASVGGLDVYLLLPGQTPEDVDPMFSDLALGRVDVESVVPDEYDVLAFDNSNDSLLLGPERFSLRGGKAYHLDIMDLPGGGTPVTLRVVEESLVFD